MHPPHPLPVDVRLLVLRLCVDGMPRPRELTGDESSCGATNSARTSAHLCGWYVYILGRAGRVLGCRLRGWVGRLGEPCRCSVHLFTRFVLNLHRYHARSLR